MPKIITSNSSSSGASEFQQLNADWESNRGVTEILNKPKNATTTKDGFMSKEDKVKLNGVTESPTKLSQLSKDINFDERYYTETEMDAKLGGKVDDSRVLTDVPLNAKFTDTNTTYSEITTSEIDIGTASTLRTITGRRIQYIIDKVTTLISSAISNLTKSNVGLDMVDNVKQASKSEFDTHNTDAVKHITPTERNTWNTVTGKASTVHTHSKSQITDFPASLPADGGNADTVSGFTVGINVPSNAKFTDTNTTYSEITTTEIDLGTASTSRVITARRVQYILDKVGSMISTAIGALTKSSVGLDNVDNTSDISKPISTATQTALNGKVNNSQVLTNVPLGAKFTDTIYTHPSTHPYSMISGTPTSLPANGGNSDTVDGKHASDFTPSNHTDDISHLPFVVGTQTATTASWTGNAPSLKELVNGTTIRYWLPRTSASNVTLELTLADGNTTGAIPCYYSNSTRLSTHYATGNIIVLTYVNGVTANGTTRSGWYAQSQYNSTYSVITEVELNTGTATTGRLLSAQRITYMFNKVSDMISTAISNLTKNDVGLGNVTNESKTTMFTSPTLTGIPKAPTAIVGTNTTQIATTAFVQSSLSGAGLGDMLKSVYDKDGDGIVDYANKGVNGTDYTTSKLRNIRMVEVGQSLPTLENGEILLVYDTGVLQ